ncbi:hypothetical protein ACJX0J_010219, partial [Zea mays]
TWNRQLPQATMLACLYSLLMTDDAESEPCMDKILERYERYSYAEKVLISAEYETQLFLI